MALLRPLARSQLRSSLRTFSTAELSALKGRSAIITGASRGIGFAIAQAFVRYGASCLLLSRNTEALHAAAENLRAESNSHNDVAWLSADITLSETWSGLFDHTKNDSSTSKSVDWIKKYPNPHILVNAAGITHSSLFLRTSPSIQSNILDTNFVGTMTACREVGKHMIKRKGIRADSFESCIINVSSLLASHGGRGSSIYAASKAGVLGLTRALAAEFGPLGVRVNALVPGYVDTFMTKGMSEVRRFLHRVHAFLSGARKSVQILCGAKACDPDMNQKTKSELLKKIPLGRFGRAEEMAHAALFLATNEYANNCIINLDGGLSSSL